MTTHEVFLVESGGEICCLNNDGINGEILLKLTGRGYLTAFPTKQAAERAIARSMAYAEKHGYSWDPFKLVRFSRG